MTPLLSIIIPVLNEEHTINDALMALARQGGVGQSEIIVVDGDTKGSTVSVINQTSVRKILSQPGRGRQMDVGARHARGQIFLFLHADTKLPQNALNHIFQLRLNTTWAGGAFDLTIEDPSRVFRMIEKTASIRSRLTRMPYGDQALFLSRHWYQKIGGFKHLNIFEDVDLMWRLKRTGGKIHFIPKPVKTSARRWHKEGIINCTLRNWLILIAFGMGVNPDTLSKYY